LKNLIRLTDWILIHLKQEKTRLPITKEAKAFVKKNAPYNVIQARHIKGLIIASIRTAESCAALATLCIF
jgi:hypothetical protein